MKVPATPTNEEARLRDLLDYAILDSIEEQSFNDIVSLAASITGAPIALISLVDRDRQWFKAKTGLSTSETGRDISFCGHAILQEGVFEINNALQDQRFCDNPLVTGDPKIRFYAGAPLVSPVGHSLGTLCVINQCEQHLSQEQREALKALARQVIALLEWRKSLAILRAQKHDLQMAHEAALQATREKARFLAHMSHEIRTPLNGIIGLGEVLGDTPLNPDQQSLLGSLKSSSHILLALLNDILDFSKIEAGKMQLEKQDIELVQLLRQLVQAQTVLAEKKGLQLKLVVPAQNYLVRGDSLRLSQILNNFLSNAIKFSERGAIVLKMEAVSDRDFLFSVKDEGIGLSEEHKRQIFQPFTQVDASMSRRYGGSGLGLSISKSLTEMMGGQIGVESELNKGARFWVRLAFESARSVNMLSPWQDASIEGTLQGLVLLAEDNAVNQLVTKHHLEKLGLQVLVAKNGQEAVEIWQKQECSLIFMDCHMPVMDGWEATETIRKLEITLGKAPLPIIGLSANALDKDVELSLVKGMTAYLVKPCPIRMLYEAMFTHAPQTLRQRAS